MQEQSNLINKYSNYKEIKKQSLGWKLTKSRILQNDEVILCYHSLICSEVLPVKFFFVVDCSPQL